MGVSKYIINQPLDIKNLDAYLLYVSTAKYEGEWECTMHTHYFAEIFYIIKGSCSFIIENQVFTAKENDLVIINPNVEHNEKSNGSHQFEYIVFGIKGLAFHFDKEDALQYSICNTLEHKQKVQLFLTSIISEIEDQKPEYERICIHLIEVLLLQLERYANYQYKSANVILSKKINKECSKIKRYLEINYYEHITLEKLAEISHMNKYYVTHAFTKYTGHSPISYLNSRRIEQSRDLLENTDYSIAQISNGMGFSSQAYFSQAFKKCLGMSPNEYRKMAKDKK